MSAIRTPARRSRVTVLTAVVGCLLWSGAPAVAAPPSPAPAPPPLTGLALGPDRLPHCATVVAAMPHRARLAQRLIVGVEAGDPRGTAETVRSTQVGGIFLGGNATDLLRDQALRETRAMARLPLAVSVDDEGGRVQRIDDLDGKLPSARVMSGMSTLQVRELGRDRGRELAARGVTMNFAPTVDVSGQPSGSVIGDRSFGNDPEQVTNYAGAFAQGQREAGVFTVLKHFPGHGHAAGDSHRGRVTTPPLEKLRADDLEPYKALIGPGGTLAGGGGPVGRTGVMVGHLDVPGLTTDLPSSLTPAVYELLRRDYGFDGLVVTDDLGAMAAITGTFELPEAVERALGAGADVALWSAGGRVAAVLDRLDEALTAGRLDGAANNRAVERVLAAKGVCS